MENSCTLGCGLWLGAGHIVTYPKGCVCFQLSTLAGDRESFACKPFRQNVKGHQGLKPLCLDS